MASKKTPIVGVRGVFKVRAPFELANDKIYVCEAVRSFADLYQKNIDVYAQYYDSKGIPRSAFEEDRKQSANIVTLITDDASSGKEVVYIPDTYITSFPSLSGVRYNRVVLSVDFSLLPESVSIDEVKSRVGVIGSEIIGKVPDVNVHIAPYKGHVSDSEHQALEASRKDNIRYQDTDRAMYLQERSRNEDLIKRIKTLETILIDNGLI